MSESLNGKIFIGYRVNILGLSPAGIESLALRNLRGSQG